MKASPILATIVCSLVVGLAMGGADRYLHSPNLQLALVLLLPIVLGGVFSRYFYLVPVALALGYAVFYWPGSGVSAVGGSMFLMYSPLLVLLFFVGALIGFAVAKFMSRFRNRPKASPGRLHAAKPASNPC